MSIITFYGLQGTKNSNICFLALRYNAQGKNSNICFLALWYNAQGKNNFI